MAKLIAPGLRTFPDVRGIYIRGSLARNEVVFGKSDIDLAILITQFDNGKEEGKFLYDLTKRLLMFKKLCPIIGECEIFSPADLQRYFSFKIFKAIQAKQWLPIFGERPEIKEGQLATDDIFHIIYHWYSFHLQAGLVEKKTRKLTNAFIEICRAIGYLNGHQEILIAPRQKIVEMMLEQSVVKISNRNLLIELQNILQHNFFYRLSPSFREDIFIETLKLLDNLGYRGEEIPANKFPAGEITFPEPLSFNTKKYWVLESPVNETQLRSRIKNRGFLLRYNLTTQNIFKNYIYYWNPYAYFPLTHSNPKIELPPPAPERLNRFIGKFSTKKELRLKPLYRNQNWDIYPIAAALYLYYGSGFVASDYAQLKKNFIKIFSSWPFKESNNLKDYFLSDFPVLWDIYDRWTGQDYIA